MIQRTPSTCQEVSRGERQRLSGPNHPEIIEAVEQGICSEISAIDEH